MTAKAGTAALQVRDMLQLSQDIARGRVDATVAQAPRADRWFVAGRSSVDQREGFRFRAERTSTLRTLG
jgi:hypothetical protein